MTFITTTIAGAQWVTGVFGPFNIDMLLNGLPYSLSLLAIVTAHEFGHYFAAKYHNIDATLPYYIPFPPLGELLNFGTMGAVIRTKSMIKNKKQMFDIGIAGPIAGFVVCLGILIYGFMTYPGIEYVLNIHPDYFIKDPTNSESLVFGNSLLLVLLKQIFVPAGQYFPPMSEIYHYPFLCVGWFGLFITAMNMIPVGQLDGGHISYTMFGGRKSYLISITALSAIFLFGILGTVSIFMELPFSIGWSGWILWSLILFFIIKVKHPVIEDDEELGTGRRILGYISFIILILSFIPVPFDIITGI